MTREEEFEEFKKWIYYWKAKLGLASWRILYFKMQPIDEAGCPYARINYVDGQRECWVYFWGCQDGVREGWAKEKALHECLHLLLAPLKVDDEQEHVIINTIIEAFYLQ